MAQGSARNTWRHYRSGKPAGSERGMIRTMTAISNQDDFLQALRDNPQWRDAVRKGILSEELLQLPVKFDAFLEEHRATHVNIDARLDWMEGDNSAPKGEFARIQTVQDAPGIASDMGLGFVRSLSAADLSQMAANTLPRDVGSSFRNADLATLAADGTGACYIAMEVSFTADLRDCNRAVRNARLIESFTGKPAQPAIASVGNYREAEESVESGAVYWHQLEDRTPSPE